MYLIMEVHLVNQLSQVQPSVLASNCHAVRWKEMAQQSQKGEAEQAEELSYLEHVQLQLSFSGKNFFRDL